jgi:aminoglycoside phosphotransferase (APT) family kinase protein
VDHLLASGRDADVFALDDDRVLRRYRGGGDTAREAAVMAYVARLGFPVPAVHDCGGPDLVMERLDGETMLAAMIAGRLDAVAGIRLLAGLHDRLHALPARRGAHPGDRVLHLDLHPDNVMLTARGPVVIDWRNSDEGPADRDVAMTALILAQVTLRDDPPLAAAARVGLDAFLVHAPTPRRRELDHVVAMRRRDPAMTAQEVADLDRAAALVRTVDR